MRVTLPVAALRALTAAALIAALAAGPIAAAAGDTIAGTAATTPAAATPAAATPAPAAASASTPLDRYLAQLRSLDTAFVQSVADARGQQGAAGKGTLLVQRPGKFRWTYQPADGGSDSGQLLVADGRNLWFYDRELDQVTVKPLQQALAATPMLLLSGNGTDLRASFDVRNAPARDGLEWVEVRAHDPGAEFSSAQLGFRGMELARMVVHNRLGQTVTLQFHDSRRNVAIDPAQLRFTPPAGADVIGTPQP